MILQELWRAAKRGVSSTELKRAKDFIKGKMALQFEDSEHVVSWYVGQEVLTGTLLTPEQKLARFQAVTQADIARVARELFETNRIHLAIIGPYKDGKEFARLMKI
ncbi:insulinase family protein [Candidatus Uhrbacteria bacterium]|nr:insulinase family protein [Candidatus Uhrbacteria bacterium]